MSLLYVSEQTMDISYNAALYDKAPTPATTFDFVINLFLDANQLFTYRNYKENPIDPEDVNINLQISSSYLQTMLNPASAGAATTTISINPNTDPALTVDAGNHPGAVLSTMLDHGNALPLGRRFLEIAAIKIFGSAYATAAIRNDSDFNQIGAGTIYNQISDQMAGAGEPLNGTGLASGARLNMFNAYVSSGRYNSLEAGDEVDAVDFNFKGTRWEFPLTFYGSLVNSTDDVIPMTTPPLRYGSVLTFAEKSTVLLRIIDNQV